LLEHSHESQPEDWRSLATVVPGEDGYAPASTH